MPTLAIFGATGSTGQLLTEYALHDGHTVYALARTPSKLTLPGVDSERVANLHIVQGDIWNQEAVDAVIARADVVIEALGVASHRPTTVKQDGARAIIAAMAKHHKSRFVAVTSAVCDKPYFNRLPWLFRKVMAALIKHVRADLLAMERTILAEGPWLDYTVIRPPLLVPYAPPTRQCSFSAERFPAGTDRVPFADLALAMLDAAKTGAHSRQVVGMNTSVRVPMGWRETEKQRTILWDTLYTNVLRPACKVGLMLAAVLLARWVVKQQLPANS